VRVVQPTRKVTTKLKEQLDIPVKINKNWGLGMTEIILLPIDLLKSKGNCMNQPL